MKCETLLGLVALLCCTLVQAQPGINTRDNVCVGVPSISPHEIQMVMRANLWRIRRCYEKAPKSQPQRTGTPKARFSITESGQIADLGIEGIGSAVVKRCLTGELGKVSFPPLRYRLKQQVKVTYPLSVNRSIPNGMVPPRRVAYAAGAALAVAEAKEVVTITLPSKAREALAAVMGFRLPTQRDLEPKARLASGFPYPFAVATDLDGNRGDDLVIALVSRKAPVRWRLVALHHSDGPGGGYRLVTVTRSATVQRRFPARTVFSVTEESRCFCQRRCIAVASNVGLSLEYEWGGKRYLGKLERYLPHPKTR